MKHIKGTTPHLPHAELLVFVLLSKQPKTKHPKKQPQTQPTLFHQVKKHICLKDQINTVIHYAPMHEAKHPTGRKKNLYFWGVSFTEIKFKKQ